MSAAFSASSSAGAEGGEGEVGDAMVLETDGVGESKSWL